MPLIFQSHPDGTVTVYTADERASVRLDESDLLTLLAAVTAGDDQTELRDPDRTGGL